MIITNIAQLLHFDENKDNFLLENAYMIVEGDRIKKIGEMKDLPKGDFGEIINIENRVVTPGFIDSHTHLIFGGNRSDEFELRAKGADYEEILKAGGGINNTVTATRGASFAQLLLDSQKKMKKALSYGVTTIEIKSGYGLDEDTELKILKVAKQLDKFYRQRVKATYLGAHIIPKEYKENRSEYISLITEKMIPLISKEKLADSVDIFIENSAYSIEEAEIIIKKAKEYDLDIHLHAEQLSHQGAIELGVKYNALSVDHLEFHNENDIKLLKNSNTVATLLPIAILFLGKDNYPDGGDLIKRGVRVALATDFNPGSAHSLNMNLVISLGVLKHKMSVEDAIKGVTLNAAYALGMQKEIGSLEVGKKADFLIHNTDNYKNLAYQMGDSLLYKVFINGEKTCFMR